MSNGYIPGCYCWRCHRSRAENPTLPMVQRSLDSLFWCLSKADCDQARDAWNQRVTDEYNAQIRAREFAIRARREAAK